MFGSKPENAALGIKIVLEIPLLGPAGSEPRFSRLRRKV
jgi:hypothetical protein